MTNLDKYIEQLNSPDKNERYDACEELRVASNLPEKAIFALQESTNDSDAIVAEAAQRALALHTSQLIPNAVDDVVDEKSDSEIARKENRFMILIRAILLSFGALFILFKVQDFWEYAVGWKNPIWPYYLAGAVLVGLIYYLDNKILPNKSKDKSRKPNSSAGLVSALALTLGLGIPAFLGTFILMNVSGIFLICTAPIALICFIGAMILLSKLGQLFS